MKILITAISLCVLAFLLFKGAEEFIHCIVGKKNNKSGIVKNIFRFVSITFIIITLLMGIALFIWTVVFVIKYQGIDAEIKGIKDALESDGYSTKLSLSLLLSFRIVTIGTFIELLYCIMRRFKGRLISNVSLVISVYFIVAYILLAVIEFDSIFGTDVGILSLLLYSIIDFGYFSVAFNYKKICKR